MTFFVNITRWEEGGRHEERYKNIKSLFQKYSFISFALLTESFCFFLGQGISVYGKDYVAINEEDNAKTKIAKDVNRKVDLSTKDNPSIRGANKDKRVDNFNTRGADTDEIDIDRVNADKIEIDKEDIDLTSIGGVDIDRRANANGRVNNLYTKNKYRWSRCKQS